MIRHPFRAGFALALVSMSGGAFAATADEEYSAQYDRCLKDGGGVNNSTVISCSESVSAKAKAEMNALYMKVYTRLAAKSPDDAEKLERTQKAWLVYRNGQCELAGSYVGTPMVGFCPMMLNIQRVDELREMAGQ